MTAIDIESKRKQREMGAATLLDAIDAQDEGAGNVGGDTASPEPATTNIYSRFKQSVL